MSTKKTPTNLERARADAASLVRDGYDAMADAYLAARRIDDGTPDLLLLTEVLAELKPGSRVLDVGCGAGLPVGTMITERGHIYTGVDISEAQIELARRQLPEADLVVGDITELEFPRGRFDLIAAYFSVFHVPREQHAALFAKFHKWLDDDGVLVLTLGRDDQDRDVSDSWLGHAPMVWSHFDTATTVELLGDAGLVVRELRQVPETLDGGEFTHPFAICQRVPAAP